MQRCPNGHLDSLVGNTDDLEYYGDQEELELDNWKHCPVCGAALVDVEPPSEDQIDEAVEEENDRREEGEIL